MFRYSLARLMAVIFVVAITLGVIRFFGPSGLIIAVCVFFASMAPIVASKRRGLDPTIGIYSVGCGALGGMSGGILIGSNPVIFGPTLVGLGAFLGGIYWVMAVSVRLPNIEASQEPTGAKPSKYLMLACLAIVCGPLLPGILYLIFNDDMEMDQWAAFMDVVVVGLIGGSLFAVPCFLAWLVHLAHRR
jgi:hypothetical protein